MADFEKVSSQEPIKEVIKSAFDTTLEVSGGWGYDQDLATVLYSSPLPLTQLQHMLVSMRSYIEMNMTRTPTERYGSINVKEIQREHIEQKTAIYEKVTYEITGMLEQRYNSFIKAYKEGYGKEEFDIKEHFSQREEETLKREESYWFEVSKVV